MAFLHSFAFPDFLDSLVSLSAACVLGTLIGAERQYRQRGGGLRTHVLVALGAATFVDIGMHINGNAGATQIIAYVVSGVGFLGAGVIMKQGNNVWGLNTAATLWCSAAVGLLAGAGYWRHALLAAVLVVGVNLVLRPLVSLVNRQPIESADIETSYVVNVTCQAADEAQIRALLVQGVGVSDLHLRELESIEIEGTGRVEVTATLTSDKRREIALEYIVGHLSVEPGVTAARWRMVNTIL